ncbi:hypothetical protein [uncultured Helicobacter sp.]|uniref:hypothetical protein n=1 Tax=uncultured Helicobacter sp. TaxID=175537 RepID=UPI00375265E1
MVYRKRASPSGVPDAATLRDSVTLLKSAVYVRVSGVSEDSFLASDNKFVKQTCIKFIENVLAQAAFLTRRH